MANILVCDDDREIVEAIAIYLREEGYQVYRAYDGEQAMELLSREQIHLLLMDVMIAAIYCIQSESVSPVLHRRLLLSCHH